MQTLVNYTVTGYRLLQGIKQEQQGSLSHHEDGRILGVMRSGKLSRLVVGLYVPDDSDIFLLDMPDFQQRQLSVLYSLTSETLSRNNSPHGNYRGFWAFVDISSNPLIDKIRSTQKVKKLEGLSVVFLKRSCFLDKNMRNVEKVGKHKDQKAFFTFHDN